MKRYIIIVAGGKGLRMGQDLPKQFIEICGTPVLMHTISSFYNADNDIDIILVLPQDHIGFWKELCEKHNFRIEHRIATGGETRFHSVSNGLALVAGDSLVGVHDGVRPFVSCEVINECFESAQEKGGVIPVIDIVDSVREITSSGSITVDRNKYKLVQTPQVFLSSLLKEAYDTEYDNFFTDDASVFERKGYDITLVKGNRENIKITTPFDLIIASALIENRK